MKPLSDLISQITDERILKILNKLGASEEGWISMGDNIFLCNISIAEAMIKDWREHIKYFKDRLSYFPNRYKYRIKILRSKIKRLTSLLDKAYFYVIKDEAIATFVDSPERCVEFFGEGQK